ncbi:hypothetical protein ACOMHN_033222 [Nucella lapillus]
MMKKIVEIIMVIISVRVVRAGLNVPYLSTIYPLTTATFAILVTVMVTVKVRVNVKAVRMTLLLTPIILTVMATVVEVEWRVEAAVEAVNEMVHSGAVARDLNVKGVIFLWC